MPMPMPMPKRRARLPLLAATTVLLCGAAGSVLAQKPAWTPIAELLIGSLGEADASRMSDVMTRCTGLHMTLAGMAADFSPEMSQHYKDEAARMISQGVFIESEMEKEETGAAEADIAALSDATIAKLKIIISGYSDWMDENIANGDSYFSKEIELEMDSCSLASRLMSQI